MPGPGRLQRLRERLAALRPRQRLGGPRPRWRLGGPRLRERLAAARRRRREPPASAEPRRGGESEPPASAEPRRGGESEPFDLERPTLGDLHEGRRERLRRRLERIFDRGAGLGVGARLGGAARALGNRISSAGAALGSALSAAATGVGDLWLDLPLIARQRIAAGAALAALAALFVVLVVPNAPCAFPGGDRCPPKDEAIELAPPDAAAYLHANLDLDTDQFEAGEQLAERLPLLAGEAAGLIGAVAGLELDFERDVRPWSGGEVAVVVAADGLEAGRLALLEADDPDAALELADTLHGGGIEESEVEGTAIRVDRRGRASALVDGFLAIGPERLVRDAIERAADPAGESLTDDAGAVRALDELPDDRLAEAYLSADLAEVLVRDEALAGLNTFVNAGATKGFAASLSVDAGGDRHAVSLSVRSVQDPESERASAFTALPLFEPGLPGQVGADVYAFLGLGEAGEAAASLLERASEVSPPLARSWRAFNRRLVREGGVDVEAGLLPLLGGEAALTVEPKAEPGEDEGEEDDAAGSPRRFAAPYLALLADDVEGDAARGRLAELQLPIARAIDPARGQAAAFQTLEVGDIEAQVLRLGPTVELTYAAFDDRLVAGSDRIAVARATAIDEPLADADAYEAAVGALPDELSLIVYLAVPELLALGEEVAALALIPEYSRLAADLKRIEAAALGIAATPELLATDLRLAVAPESDQADQEIEIEPGIEPEIEPEP